MQQLSSESDYANRFQLVSRMADDLAHEIKNPLNSMVINLEVLRSRARKGDVDGVIDRAAVLEAEVMRLNGLIDGVLKLLRPDRSGQTPFSIDALLTEIGGVVGVQAKLARKQLDVTSVGESAMTVGRDAVRFALLNILAAELRHVTGDEARITIGGTTGAAGTTVRIASFSEPAAASGPQEALDAAVGIARTLLSEMGGTVEVTLSGAETGNRVVTVGLPPMRRA